MEGGIRGEGRAARSLGFAWRAVVAAVGLGALGAISDARAGPWTLPQGATQQFIEIEARKAPARFDAIGAPTSGERYSGTASVTLERGLQDWLTLGLKSEGRGVLLETDGVDAANVGEAERGIWGRARLWSNDHWVASAQLGYSMAGDLPEVAGAELGDGANEIEGRALVGRGWSAGPALGWLSAEAAYRSRDHGARDQVRLDLTAGVRPTAAPRLLAFGQMFATKAVGPGEMGDYDLLKVSGKVGVEVTSSMTVVLGATHEAAGRGITRGDSASIGLWLRF